LPNRPMRKPAGPRHLCPSFVCPALSRFVQEETDKSVGPRYKQGHHMQPLSLF
jgi:hypothetical protein